MRDALGSVGSVLVLGGGSDIGAAIVRKLVAGRTRVVVLAGRHPEQYKPLADELRTAGATDVATAEFDAAAPEAHAAFVDETWGRHGDIDLAIVAFGVLPDQDAVDEDPEA